MNIERLYATCSILIGNLPKDGWALTGGASLYMRGVLDTANDIDIIATRECALSAAVSLFNCRIRPLSQSQCGDVRSLFADYMIAGVRTEIMADVYNRSENGIWRPHTDWKSNIVAVRLRSLVLPMLKLEYEAHIASMLNQSRRLQCIVDELSGGEQGGAAEWSTTG